MLGSTRLVTPLVWYPYGENKQYHHAK